MKVAQLSNSIEAFILSLMAAEEEAVELQRNELASHFGCAPSQINYVLATRFTPDRGYIIESRRGGGGYIRVVRMRTDPDDYLRELLTRRCEEAITAEEAAQIIARLSHSLGLSRREAALMNAAVSDRAIGLPAPVRHQARARILKSMVIALMGQNNR